MIVSRSNSPLGASGGARPGLSTMDISLLVLAFASVPLGVIALCDLIADRKMRGLFGMTSAAWSASGVVLVYVGVPGIVFFPGLLVILILSTLVQGREGGGRLQYVKASSLSVLLVLITLGLVLL